MTEDEEDIDFVDIALLPTMSMDWFGIACWCSRGVSGRLFCCWDALVRSGGLDDGGRTITDVFFSYDGSIADAIVD